MESALIVSCTDKGTAFFAGLLNAASINQIAVLQSCAEAKRLLLERHFDLAVIDAPLRDETGESLARNTASKGTTLVMLAINNERFDAVSALCADDGVLVMAKPILKTTFWSALKFAKSIQNRLKLLQIENEKLKQKIENIRIVDRAKWILVSQAKMSEQGAHRYIEKQAMDMRSTKRAVAEGILKTYEN